MGRVFEYEGERIVVSYDVKRCIHAKACVHGLGTVFDPDRRPWVSPDEADPDEVAEVVEQCPTGALHYRRTDDGSEEFPPEKASIRIEPSGPLWVEGAVELVDPGGEVRWRDTRLALCRCGASKNKPFCDNSHETIDFTTEPPL